MQKKIIAVVLPCYKVEKRVKEVITSLQSYVDFIVAVDDGSPDTTGEILLQCPCIVLKHIINRGQGAALMTGTEFAVKNGADIIIHFDSDGQHMTEDIPTLIEPLLNETHDVVFGSRFLGKEAIHMPWTKRFILLPVGRLVNFLFSGLILSDAHNGLRAMNAFAAKSIRINQDRMAHNSEINEEVLIHSLRYTEVPITVKYFEYGQGLRGGIRVVKELLIGKLFK